MRRRAPSWLAALATVAAVAVIPASSMPGTTVAAGAPAARRAAVAGPDATPERRWPVALVAQKDAAFGGTRTAAGAEAGEVAMVPPSAPFEGAAAGPEATPRTLHAATLPKGEGGVWAVVVGIDDYPGRSSDLRASVSDADATHAALTAYGVPASRIVELRNGQASATMIRASLRWLVERAGTDATAVFFYAGHIRKIGASREAIVAADGRLVTDADVAWDLKHLRAAHTWIALAACYAGGFTEVLAPGRIVTGAADASSLAYESTTYGRSYLGEFMIHRAMRNGWAAGSVEQAFAWAQEELRRSHPKRLLVQYDMVDGDLALGAPPPAQPLPESSPSGAPEQQPQPQPQPESPPPPPPSEPEDDDGGCLLGVLGSACGDE